MKELKNIKIEKGIGLNESLIVKGKVPLGVWLKIQVPGFKELYGRFKRKGRGLNAEYTEYDFIGLGIHSSHIPRGYSIIKYNGYGFFLASRNETRFSLGNMGWTLFEVASLQEAKRIVKQLIKSIASGHIR